MLTTLQGRLLLPLLVVVAVICLLAGYNAFVVRDYEAQQTQMTALRLAKHIALDQESHIDDARDLLTLIARLNGPELVSGGQRCDRFLAEIRRSHAQYANIGVVDNDGRILCSAIPFDDDVRLDHRPYFKRALETGAFAVGDYQVGLVTGRGSLNAGYPLKDGNGNVQAVLFVALDLAWLGRSLSRVPLPESTIVSLVSGNGTILARYPDDNLVGTTFGQGYTLPVYSGEEESMGNFINPKGDVRLYASALLTTWNGEKPRVVVSISSHTAYGKTDALFIRQIVGLLIVSLLAVGVAWAWSRRLVVKPVEALVRASREISSGNLTARVGLASPIREMTQLADSFDDMAESLEAKYRQIERQDLELVRANRALQTLSAGNHTLLRAVEENSLLREMCQTAVRVGGYTMAWVGYAEDDDEKTIRPMAKAGPDEDFTSGVVLSWGETAEGATPAGLAIRSAKPVIERALQTDQKFEQRWELFRKFGIHASLSLPLVVNSRIIGVFTIYSEDQDAFDTREVAILEEMSQDLAFGIHTLRTRATKEAAEQSIRHMAFHDPLTDLPNARQLEVWLNEHLDSSVEENRKFGLLCIGLERLREINVSLGHDTGNKVLRETASRLGKELRPAEKLARLQGDEFALLSPGTDLSASAARASDIIHAVDGQNVHLDGFNFVVHLKAGVVHTPEHGSTVTQLLQRASTALQLAKDNKQGYAIYSPKEDKEKKYLLDLAGKLSEALDQDQLELAYQPKISMQSGRVCGIEGLARWRHPEMGMVPPDVFIPVAESTGLILRLSRWAVDTALFQMHQWRQVGIQFPMAVNLSPQDIHDDTFIDYIGDRMARWEVPPGQFEIEITEGAIMTEPEKAMENLERLRALGIALYIDDFGTGFSSLSTLKKYPFNAIKIDKSFVIDMLEDHDANIIVASTINLAHELNLGVVAEGVETEEVWDALAGLGCNIAQGYFMAKPMSAANLEAWVRESEWGSRSVN